MENYLIYIFEHYLMFFSKERELLGENFWSLLGISHCGKEMSKWSPFCYQPQVWHVITRFPSFPFYDLAIVPRLIMSPNCLILGTTWSGLILINLSLIDMLGSKLKSSKTGKATNIALSSELQSLI